MARQTTTLMRVDRQSEVCLQMTDNGRTAVSAEDFFQVEGRVPAAGAARLAGQFLRSNRRVLDRLQIQAHHEYDGNSVCLVLEAGSAVGAVPLVSPLSGKFDYGLVVQPRFPWPGLGPLLARMGWRVVPSPLKLPLLRRSERRIPAWVMSLMVLNRVEALLKNLDRRFEQTSEELPAPKGQVEWQAYATGSLPRGRFLDVPCVFPDLRDNRQLMGAIRFTVEAQRRSLASQCEHGAFVHRLMDRADALLQRVRAVAASRPQEGQMKSWLNTPMRSDAYFEGLQAIDWTIDERGLAGPSDLEGIPWTMPMDAFFEAWVEVVMQRVAEQTGGLLRCGRLQQTVASIHWDPPYTGSQRSLRPDLVLAGDEFTVIVDAKYKRHFEELSNSRWDHLDDWLREEHRNDIFQALAYGSLSDSRHTICMLAYPCRLDTWESLKRRGLLVHRASIPAQSRSVALWLTAVPMVESVDEVSTHLAGEIRRCVREAA